MQALCMFPALAATAMLLRIGAGLNKYLVWSVMGILVQFARRATPIVPAAERYAVPQWLWPVAAATTLSASFALFVVRSAQRRAAAANSEAAPAKPLEMVEEKDAKTVKGG